LHFFASPIDDGESAIPKKLSEAPCAHPWLPSQLLSPGMQGPAAESFILDGSLVLISLTLWVLVGRIGRPVDPG